MEDDEQENLIHCFIKLISTNPLGGNEDIEGEVKEEGEGLI